MAFSFLTNSSYRRVFLTTSLPTTSLSFLESKGTALKLSISNLSTLIFKLFKLPGTFLIHQDLIYQLLILN